MTINLTLQFESSSSISIPTVYIITEKEYWTSSNVGIIIFSFSRSIYFSLWN